MKRKVHNFKHIKLNSYSLRDIENSTCLKVHKEFEDDERKRESEEMREFGRMKESECARKRKRGGKFL